jgi:hypothetical protein
LEKISNHSKKNLSIILQKVEFQTDMANQGFVEQKLGIMRKMGAAEVLYDHEVSIGNLFLVHSFKIQTKINFIENRELVVNAINYWKQINPLLNSKILTVDKDECFATEKYFVYADESKINTCDNLKMYSLKNIERSGDPDQYWSLLYEYEMNKPFVDTETGLLWRVMFIQNDPSEQENFTYWIIFTAHHAIVDARNVFVLHQELFEIIEDLKNGVFEIKPTKCLQPSIEEKLFENDEAKLRDIKLTPNKIFTEFSKIPKSFGTNREFISDSSLTQEGEFLDKKNNEMLKIKDLVTKRNLDFITLSKVFVVKKDIFSRLMKKCKTMQAKLTGCLHVITAMATQNLYKALVPDESAMYETIQYQLVINLRPFLQPPLDNSATGYWAIILAGLLSSTDLQNDFWHAAKLESDLIHERIGQNEHFESSKFDTLLLDQMKSGATYEDGGGYHFALSNLGNMGANPSDKQIKIVEHHFGLSFLEKRWVTVIFHGITTIDDELFWSITYNSKLIREDIVDTLVKNINKIILEII